jgi:hypothetical protein
MKAMHGKALKVATVNLEEGLRGLRG